MYTNEGYYYQDNPQNQYALDQGYSSYPQSMDSAYPFGNQSAPYAGPQVPSMAPNFSNAAPPRFYAKGGQVKAQAQKLQSYGRNGDTILAHINPEEAQMLKDAGGSGTINPKTGLPEFGKFWRKVGQLAGAIAGTAIGGPMGGAIGGGLVGASQRGGGNKLKGALQGGLTGLGYAAAAPMLGSALGVAPGGAFGNMLGMSSPSLMNQFGLSAAPDTGGGLGLLGNGGALSNILGSNGSSGAASQGAASSGFGFGGGMLNPLLLGTALAGTVMRKEKPMKTESLQEYMARHKAAEDPRNAYREVPPLRRRLIEGARGDAEQPETEYYEYYKDGGYLSGHTDGQSDAVEAYVGRQPVRLSDGERITCAPAVAIAGGGNSNAGNRAFQLAQDELLRLGAKHGGHLPKGKNLQMIIGKAMIKASKKRAA